MKRYINIFAALAVAIIFAGCSKEDPFPGPDGDTVMGKVLKSSLTPELNGEGIPSFSRPATRAEAPSADDFTVAFIKEGESEPYISYLFSDMPEIVTLPVGAYKAVASYGDNKTAAWEEPYFKGETTFNVVKDQITEVEDPIVATLANVRVSITFAPTLKASMSSDSKVTVKVGDSGSLDFTAADEGRSAYFAYVENSNSITATFVGKIDGYDTTKSLGYEDVAPGKHYSITFRMHDVGVDEVGGLEGTFSVDASVEIVDLNMTIDGEEDEIINDDLRPKEEEEEDPGQGGNGGDDPVVNPDKKLPYVEVMLSAIEPARTQLVDFSKENVINDNLACAWKVISESETGFTEFKVQINSDTLTPGVLDEVGLRQNIDLINPGDLKDALSGEPLYFPVEIYGHKEAEFDITPFLGMLQILGPGLSEFKLTISDGNGTSEYSLRLRIN